MNKHPKFKTLLMLSFALAFGSVNAELTKNSSVELQPEQASGATLNSSGESRPAQLPKIEPSSTSAVTLDTPKGVNSAQVSPIEPKAPEITENNGLAVTPNELKQLIIKNSNKLQFMVYRPNPAMPEVTNESFIVGRTQDGKIPNLDTILLGYAPEIRLLPCDVGCNGPAYEKAAIAFIQGYNSAMKHYNPRGKFLVRVRWFHSSSFLEGMSPVANDEFGVSFALEGKLVSGGTRTRSKSYKAHELARELGAQLGLSLTLKMGMGQKPMFLTEKEAHLIGDTLEKAFIEPKRNIEALFGVEDIRVRLEPLTDKNSVGLLPAIDGVLAGEVNPITEAKFPLNVLF